MGKNSSQLCIAIVLGMIFLWNSVAIAQEKTENTLTVGISLSESPYAFENDDGELVGLDLDIIQEIAKRLDVTLEIRVLPAEELVAALQSQQVMVAVYRVNMPEDRIEELDVTLPYYQPIDAALVRQDWKWIVKGMRGTQGFQVGVLKGSRQEFMYRHNQIPGGFMKEDQLLSYADIDQALPGFARSKIRSWVC
jgi:polar amino acid transport system substrate-binding protein